jgi:hypothetical protein
MKAIYEAAPMTAVISSIARAIDLRVVRNIEASWKSWTGIWQRFPAVGSFILY